MSFRPPMGVSLLVWLDGLDIDGARNTTLTPGAAVGRWVNKGALGRAYDMVQATGAQQPLFAVDGKFGALDFDGVDDVMTSALDWSAAIPRQDLGAPSTQWNMVAAVLKWTAIPQGAFAVGIKMGGGAQNGGLCTHASVAGRFAYAMSSVGSGFWPNVTGSANTTQYHVHVGCGRNSSGTQGFAALGWNNSTGNAANGTNQFGYAQENLFLGGRSAVPLTPANVRICEVLAYGPVYAPNNPYQSSGIYRYFLQKYGAFPQ